MAADSIKLIDASVKESVLRYPTMDLIRKLFPDAVARGRSVMCNPLRGEKHASLSCFKGYDGYSRWKDHATGETGDNIDFFRKVYPELSYVEAVERLSLLVLGKSALQDIQPGMTISFDRGVRRQAGHHVPVQEKPSALQPVLVQPFLADGSVPAHLVEYTRERGISDEVAHRYFCYVRFRNTNRSGRSVIDPTSGLPVLDESGEIVRDDGLNDAVALRNDIGGFSFRVPEGPAADGFKGSNMCFMTTVLADGSAPAQVVKLAGKGDNLVTYFRYDESRQRLFINDSQAFIHVQPYVARFGMVFLDSWMGRYIEGRDLNAVVSVLNAMNGPVNRKVSVVEGMFDGASVIELERMSGHGTAPGRDLVILNSLSNLRWAVPFLAMHGEVQSLLDNDLRSAAGEKAFVVLKESVDSFASRVCVGCQVKSSSYLFYPSKDMNDFLKSVKGFRLKTEEPRQDKRRKKSSGMNKAPKGQHLG